MRYEPSRQITRRSSRVEDCAVTHGITLLYLPTVYFLLINKLYGVISHSNRK